VSETTFQSVPVPDRFVLRVMSCITEWTADEESPEAAESPVAADVWSAHDLRKLSDDRQVKTPQIITKMLDFLAATPGEYHRSEVIGRNIDVPADSVSAALRQLDGYLKSRAFQRTDRPFTRLGNENAYAVTVAQAKAWLDARRI
jgi:hypothetical protein